MPRYDRQCERCGHRFETVERMRAARVQACPACGKRAAVRVPSAPALQTDTSLSDRLRRSYGVAGYRVAERSDLRKAEAAGHVILNDRDRDYYERRNAPRVVRDTKGRKVSIGKQAQEASRRAAGRIRDARRVTVRST